jgi:hypothetical protein
LDVLAAIHCNRLDSSGKAWTVFVPSDWTSYAYLMWCVLQREKAKVEFLVLSYEKLPMGETKLGD